MIRIIGIDPGLNNTGYGVIDFQNNSYSIIESGVIKTSVQQSLSDRLIVIHNKLCGIIEATKPQTAAIECTYVNKGNDSSIKLAHARATAILTTKLMRLDIAEYQAKTIKKTICGNGNADKSQMIAMLNYLMPNTKITNSDEADAVSIAICHGFYYKANGASTHQI